MSAIAIRRGDWRAAIRPLAADHAFAAMGDVHGHDDLFAALTDAVAADISGARDKTVAQLGDLVDRGPSSHAALKRAKAGLAGAKTIVLTGNHEERMLRAALSDDAGERRSWLGFGGRETLLSAGVDPDAPDWPERLRGALGDDMLAWLAGLPRKARVGGLFLAHAGIDPGTPLADQDAHTLVWTRWPWLDSAGPYPENVAVLHGHTPRLPVDLGHPHRINLDSGAYQTGVLSALVIAGDRMRLVQAAR